VKTIVDIRNFTRRAPAPGVPFNTIAQAVLPGWEISLVFAGQTRARQINIALRAKEYVPNVLSYETGKKSGEIIICPSVAKKQHASYGMPYKDFVAFLFIHGLLHLKGHPHGATMERYERTLLARFNLKLPYSSNGTTHRNRH
jgi:probable rRNA maturation factor